MSIVIQIQAPFMQRVYWPLFTCQVLGRDIYYIWGYAEIIKIGDILMNVLGPFGPGGFVPLINDQSWWLKVQSQTIPSANIIRNNGIQSLPHAFLDTSLHVNQLCKALWVEISMGPNKGHHFFIQLFLHRWITRQIVQEPQQSNGCLSR